MPDSFDYTTGTNSENVRLLQALIDDAPEYTEETNSRNANILKSIINNTEYTDAPQSEIEELLLRLKAKIGGEIEVDELNVTENGTYDAGVNKAYNPVKVELPLSSKTITENGTYQASDDNLAGFNEVTVAVEGYAKKSISPTPTPIATFNASALPMPSLNVGIEAVQAGTGDPSPTNVRPISGWSAVNRYRSGKNLCNFVDKTITEGAYVINNAPMCLPQGSYVLSFDFTGTTSSSSFRIDDKNGNSIFSTNKVVSEGRNSVPISLSQTGFYVKYYSNAIGEYTNFQIEQDTTATTYEAFSGTTYITTLKDGQGNPMECYGGQLVNENGVQSLTNRFNDVDMGLLNWTKVPDWNGEPAFASDIQNDFKQMPNDQIANIMCSRYKTYSRNDLYNSPNLDGICGTFSQTFVVRDSNYASYTAEQFKTAMSGVKLVYELTTPQQIPQDSLSIATQEGVNNLWADSGEIQSGEYMEAL